MLNHARTLLLNISGDSNPGADFLAEEIVPAEYRKLELPNALNQVRRQLFGSDPDRAMLNYRTRQLLKLLHSTELLEHVVDLDPRLSYDTAADSEIVLDTAFQPQVSAINSPDLRVLGSPVAPDARGRLAYAYVLRTVGSTQEVQEIQPYAGQQTYGYEFTDGWSPPIVLPTTGYSVSLPEVDDGYWKINFMLRPQWDLGQIAVALESIGEPTMLALFGVSRDEPWNTFRYLWYQHTELPYKLGGLLLALIYRTEEVRLGQS